jgi:hypothetical protein
VSEVDADLRRGRLFGALLLVQLIAAPIYNFVLLDPVFAAPGWLANAAPNARGMQWGVVLMLIGTLVDLAAVVVAWPTFRRSAPGLAMAYALLTPVSMVLTAVEGQRLLEMLSLSQQAAAAHGANGELFETLRGVVGAARNWAHYMGLLIGGVGLVTLHALLLRAALVPRALAAVGIAAGLLLVVAVTRPLFGIPVNFALLGPVGIVQLVLALWLLARGFRGSGHPAAAVS